MGEVAAALYVIRQEDNARSGGFGWNPKRNVDLASVKQILEDQRHREFGSGFLINPTKIERSVYGKITWRF